MLRLSAAQFAEMSERALVTYAARFRPLLIAEFGNDVIASIEPLEELARTSAEVKLDNGVEIYRLIRVVAALEATGAIPERRMLVAQIAGLPIQPEDRLSRLEHASMPEAQRDEWGRYYAGGG